LAKLIDPDDDSPKIGFPPPFIYLGMLLLGLLVDRLARFSPPLDEYLRIAGVAVFVPFGFTILLAASRRFSKAGTDVKPWKSSSIVVHDGIYGVTRNPMYLGMAMIYLGLALGLASITALVLLPILIATIQTQVIAREERYLEGKFGEDYSRYRHEVPRWF